jgi:anti-sigma B factor antagonist
MGERSQGNGYLFDARVVPGSTADGTVVKVSGEVDMATAPEMERILFGALESLSVSDLVVDMATATFIDCLGLGVLLAVANRARASGRSVALRNPSRQVVWVRGLTGLADLLPNEISEPVISAPR